MTASTPNEGSLAVFRYMDVVLLVVAAPLVLLVGVPALGFIVGAGAWILLRAAGRVVELLTAGLGDLRGELLARLIFPMCRIFLLGLAVIVLRKDAGKSEALTALVVAVFAFTTYFIMAFLTRPRILSRPPVDR